MVEWYGMVWYGMVWYGMVWWSVHSPVHLDQTIGGTEMSVLYVLEREIWANGKIQDFYQAENNNLWKQCVYVSLSCTDMHRKDMVVVEVIGDSTYRMVSKLQRLYIILSLAGKPWLIVHWTRFCSRHP